MAPPMGDSKRQGPRVDYDRRLAPNFNSTHPRSRQRLEWRCQGRRKTGRFHQPAGTLRGGASGHRGERVHIGRPLRRLDRPGSRSTSPERDYSRHGQQRVPAPWRPGGIGPQSWQLHANAGLAEARPSPFNWPRLPWRETCFGNSPAIR